MLRNIVPGSTSLKEHVKDFTPEWAYGITTIKPDLIRKTAKEMADASPAVIVHPGRHVTWYGDDTQRDQGNCYFKCTSGFMGQTWRFLQTGQICSVHPIAFLNSINQQKPGQDAFPGKYPIASSPVSNALIDASIPENNPGYLNKRMVCQWHKSYNIPFLIRQTQ